MIHWLQALQDDLKKQFGTRPPTATLATVRMVNGSPAATARTVVVRDIDSRGTMLIASDARSAKNVEVRRSPRATLVYWLASVKRQYRIEGIVDLSADDRSRVWTAMSDRARALFAWPPPGLPREDTFFAETITGETPLPTTFEILRLTPIEVEKLDLSGHPHERVRWALDTGDWASRRLNP